MLRAAAINCLDLKKLVIHDWDGERSSSPLEGVTNAGLIAISKLPKLDHIALMLTSASAQGILALIMNAPDPQRKRRMMVEIGCFEGGTPVYFVSGLVAFMELLV